MAPAAGALPAERASRGVDAPAGACGGVSRSSKEELGQVFEVGVGVRLAAEVVMTQ